MNAGKHVLRERDGSPARPKLAGKNCAQFDGFSLHANTVVRAKNRDDLQKLVKYMVRPAIASSRVAVTDDGQVRITLKQPYRDGTTAVVIPPKDFVLRLTAQVPLPKRKMIGYFGVFASNAKLRPAVVPAGAKPTFRRKKACVHDPVNTAELSEAASREAAKRFTWTDGLKRAFRQDALICRDCGGKRVIVAAIHDPKEIERFMRHLKIWPEPDDDLVAIRGPPEALEPPPDDDWGEAPADDPPFWEPDEWPEAA